jgi:hypothetical protein
MLKHKKVVSLVLAAAMAASLSVTAFAAGDDEDTSGQQTNNTDTTPAVEEVTTNRSMTVSGNYQAVDIAVVVPTTGNVIINPYALPVAISDDTSVNKVSAQIVTKPLAIKNRSAVKLDVNVSATATVKNNLTLATAAVTPSSETKTTAFVYLAAKTAADTTGAELALAKEYATVTWPTYGASTKGTLALKADNAVTQTGFTTLAAATEENGAFKAYGTGSIALIGLTGSVAQNPTEAWTAKDGLSVKIAFTFTPNTST